jgi:hypothetical protein
MIRLAPEHEQYSYLAAYCSACEATGHTSKNMCALFCSPSQCARGQLNTDVCFECVVLCSMQVLLQTLRSGVWWRCLTASQPHHLHPAGAAEHQVRLQAHCVACQL